MTESTRSEPALSVERLAELGARLRAEGVGCALTESTAAVAAATRLDPSDPDDARLGLRSVFCATRAELEIFERCFRNWWDDDPGRPPQSTVRAEVPAPHAAGERARRADRATPVEPDSVGSEAPRQDVIGAAYSPLDRLARRSFGSIAEEELREFDAWLDRLIVRLSARRSRRLRRGGRRGVVDVRRTLRSAARHDGELIRLARRRRRLDPPRLVVLCDVSGSMERYSRFLLRFLLGCGRAAHIQTFAFSTRLTHLTPWLAATELDPALAELRARGWSSGTRIGECLETFVERHGRRMLGQRTLVLILSDGLDQGEVEPLERSMRRIQRGARKVIWLNPLLESSRYAPEARGMRAALPYVDHFHSGHSLDALRDLPGLLRL